MKEEDIKKLFENNCDCYADTWEENDDTIPPIMVQGKVVMAMTFEAFKKVYKAASKEEVNDKVFSLTDLREIERRQLIIVVLGYAYQRTLLPLFAG